MQIRDTMPITLGGITGVKHKGGASPASSSPAAVQCQESFQKSSNESSAILCSITGNADRILNLSDVGKETWAFPVESDAMLEVQLTADDKLLCQDQNKIYSLDRNTGEKVWEVTKDRGGGSDFVSLNDGTVFLDDAVYGKVISVDGTKGTEKWRHDTEGLKDKQLVPSPDDNSLIVSGLMMKTGDSQRVIKSLDAKTGNVQWEAQFPSNLVSSVSISGDGTTCVAEVSDGLVAVDAKTGAVKWENHNLEKMKGSYVPTVGPHGDVFFTGKDQRLHAIDGATGKQKWMLPITDDMDGVPIPGPDNKLYLYGHSKLVAVDGEKGKQLWQHDFKDRNLHDMGVAPDGTIYAYGIQSKQLIAIDGKDGSVKNSYSVAKTWFQSKMSDDGTVYYAGDDFKIHAIKVVLQEEDIQQIAEQMNNLAEAQERDKVELQDDWLIIGGVKLPVK
ncbi:MAG: PQQ-binding-like beta-propeller repeat protein [Vulcanimicrobiota bacterium]